MGRTAKRMAKKSTKATKLVPAIPPLEHDPHNYRIHTPRNRDLIRQSLEEVGAGRSILVDGDNIIRAGNGVFEQAQQLGMHVTIVDAKPDELIAVRRPDLKGDAARRAALYDNQTGTTSEWDFEKLSETLQTEKELLDGIFNASELATLAHSETVAQEQIERLTEGWYVIVTCNSEQHQLELLEQFVGQGLTCRAAS